MGNSTSQPPAQVIERHAQSVVVIVIVALLIWVGTTVQANSIHLATIQVEVTQLKEAITAPNPTVALLIQQNQEFRMRMLKLEERERQ